jgi:hypothetical protein
MMVALNRGCPQFFVWTYWASCEGECRFVSLLTHSHILQHINARRPSSILCQHLLPLFQPLPILHMSPSHLTLHRSRGLRLLARLAPSYPTDRQTLSYATQPSDKRHSALPSLGIYTLFPPVKIIMYLLNISDQSHIPHTSILLI